MISMTNSEINHFQRIFRLLLSYQLKVELSKKDTARCPIYKYNYSIFILQFLRFTNKQLCQCFHEIKFLARQEDSLGKETAEELQGVYKCAGSTV
jgi:hypothetical protein